MKKKLNKPAREFQKSVKGNKVEESKMDYYPLKHVRLTKEFTFREFKKIADEVDLTQREWSDILHISERTLQRYAKDNGTFNSGVIDRILLIDKVIKKGIEVFGNAIDFITWLRDHPISIEGELDVQSLAGFDGISKVLNQLGRIEYGILA
jgi:putative toxin-antitoxin system antitoxin component (TIGR02293 family)